VTVDNRTRLEVATGRPGFAATAGRRRREPGGLVVARRPAAALRLLPDFLDHLLPLERLLELEQLAHKVEVGRDDGAPGLHEPVGIHHRHGEILDEVGHGDGGGA